MLATLLGIETGSWIAGVAVLVSIYSAAVATRSRGDARRSANAAEASAEHSGRAAAAAELSAGAAEHGLRIEEERAHHESRDRVAQQSPRWAPAQDGEAGWWISDDNNMGGALMNVGKTGALLVEATLELPTGQRLAGHGTPVDDEAISGLRARPGSTITLHFKTTARSLGAALEGGARPRVYITARSEELGTTGTQTVELRRRAGGVASALRWAPRPID